MGTRSRDLAGLGAPKELCKLVDDIVSTEDEANRTLYDLGRQREPEEEEEEPIKTTKQLIANIKEAHKQFSNEVVRLQDLAGRAGIHSEWRLSNSYLKKHKPTLVAPCDVTTDKVKIERGNKLSLRKNGKPFLVNVMTPGGGSVGHVPLLACTVPLPDKSLKGAVQRLGLHIAAAWLCKLQNYRTDILQRVTECCKQSEKGVLLNNNEALVQNPRLEQLARIANRNNSDLSQIHSALCRVLQDMEGNNNEKSSELINLEEVDDLVLNYQELYNEWQQFAGKKSSSEDSVHVVDTLSEFKPRSKHYRYYEVKITQDVTETEEVIEHRHKDEWASQVSTKSEQVETDQITSAKVEERKKFIITAVLNLKTHEEISLEDAMKEGIVNPSTGMYHNLETGEKYPIPVAMNAGHIIVELTTTNRSKEETKAVGLITIKSHNDKRPYEITHVVDPLTGQKLSVEDAIKEKVLDKENGLYVNFITEEKIPLDTAIQTGWVIVDYDPNSEEPEFITKTYAISSVVDQQEKKKVGFNEAVQMGLIERDTGNYINNLTGEHIYVGEAIKRGFLKAKVVDNDSGLNVDAENRMVVDKVKVIKNKMIKSMGVMKALKTASQAASK